MYKSIDDKVQRTPCPRCRKPAWIWRKVETLEGVAYVCQKCHKSAQKAVAKPVPKRYYCDPGGTVVAKKCSLCSSFKPAKHFYKDKKAASGLRSWCKPCEKGKR